MLSNVDVHQSLRDHAFFAGMPPGHLELIAATARLLEVPRGQFLLTEGADANLFIVIVAGKVAVEISTGIQGPLTIDTLGDGDILGWSTFHAPYKWHFDALCVVDTTVIEMDGVALRRVCDEHPDLGYDLLRRIIGIVSKRLRSARLQLMQFYA